MVSTVSRASFRVLVWIAISLHGMQLFAADIRAQIDRLSPQVAEPFWLTVVVRAPEKAAVVFPEVPEILGDLNVLSHRDRFDIPAGTQREWARHFQLESLQGGDFEIPPIAVSINGETVRSQSIDVTIASSVEADSAPFAFRDIKPPVDIPPPETGSDWLPKVIAAGATIVGLIAFTMAWFRRRRRPMAAGSWALQELERLRGSLSSSAPQPAADLISAVSDVLREYIERQLDIQATRQTTEEFLTTSQEDARLSDQQRSLLKEFLLQVDEVKFAHRPMEPGRLDEAFRLVQDFVHATSGDVG